MAKTTQKIQKPKGTVLKLSKVTKHYATQAEMLPVISNVSLTIKAGDSLAIIGESGTGKSTLLNLIGGLDYVSDGNIEVFGVPIEQLDETQLAAFRNEYIGFVFQYHHLLPDFTALENAMIPALVRKRPEAEARETAAELLTLAGLGDRMEHKPAYLSGGEQQRVAIVRALVNRPGLVLMDEPTGNLDERTGEFVMEMVWDLKKRYGLSIIIVTHNLGIARQAKRCLSLSKGKGKFIKL
jgi:lipoprotein-releasing system ATP-binding protein